MRISEIVDGKRKYMPLLLEADEQESMVERYLDRGRMFAMWNGNGVMAVCVVTDEGDGAAEIKNIAVGREFRRRGYGRMMLQYIEDLCRISGFRILYVGTGETPAALGFYQSCGFVLSHRVERFFTDNYDHPVVDDGILLCDMVYLCKPLTSAVQ